MQPDRSRAAEMVAVVSCAGILATGLVSAFGSVGWTLATAAASLAAIAAAVAARPALARVPGWRRRQCAHQAGGPARVLDALTERGWRDLSRVSEYLIDGKLYDPRDVQILTPTEADDE